MLALRDNDGARNSAAGRSNLPDLSCCYSRSHFSGTTTAWGGLADATAPIGYVLTSKRTHWNLAPRWLALSLIAAFFAIASGCREVSNSNNTSRNENGSTATANEPTIEASPVSKTDDQWQVISADKMTLSVTALDAQSVKILYRPAFTEGRHVVLKTLNGPGDGGKFTAQIKVPSDFAGDVWAEVSYRDGSKKETKPISLTVESISADELASASYKHTDESARSDKLTGGRIEKTTLQPGNGDLRITVNIPAFQLTLWQGDKEAKLYEIGIGRKDFQLPSGLRYAKQIVFNPEWIPPDSDWVYEHDAEPGEHVEADDPRNPLGKIKIPIGGGGILIHQAFKPSDIGHLVSHGCVRVRLNELYGLIDQIVAARSIKASREQMERAKNSKDRFNINLDAPLVVDINYDTQVIEAGVLHLYPDVYNKQTNTVENLRAELKEAGVDESKLDDKTLQQMLDKVTMNEEFVVSVADIKAGRALETGKTQPLTSANAAKKPPTKRNTKR
jgi:lipoprotein-anchoring transpeptidase ErfK/SrfK